MKWEELKIKDLIDLIINKFIHFAFLNSKNGTASGILIFHVRVLIKFLVWFD